VFLNQVRKKQVNMCFIQVTLWLNDISGVFRRCCM